MNENDEKRIKHFTGVIEMRDLKSSEVTDILYYVNKTGKRFERSSIIFDIFEKDKEKAHKVLKECLSSVPVLPRKIFRYYLEKDLPKPCPDNTKPLAK